MFRETFKRVKLCKQSRKYTINYTLWNLIEDSNETALPRPQASLVGLNAVRMELWVSYAITIKHRAPSCRDVWWRVRFFAVISNVSHIKASKYKTLSRNCQIKRNTLQKKKLQYTKTERPSGIMTQRVFALLRFAFYKELIFIVKRKWFTIQLDTVFQLCII